uniref:BTG family member 2 n=1 Tax=Xenopus tropicalis TaxID=8364 RepID=A0A803JSE6_XENTR
MEKKISMSLTESTQRATIAGLRENITEYFNRTFIFSTEHYMHHWFPDKPAKGSGYRCIRINHKMDPVISKVACRINMSNQHLLSLLPKELTLWVDPFEVSYRIGEDGSICVLYEASAPSARGHLNCKSELLGSSGTPSHYLMTVHS